MNCYAFSITDAEDLSRNIITEAQTFFVKTPFARLNSDEIYDTMGRLARELQIKHNVLKYDMRYDWTEVLEAYVSGEVSVGSPAFFPLGPSDMVMMKDVKGSFVVSSEDRLPLRG